VRKNPKQTNLNIPSKGRGALKRLIKKTAWTKTRVVTEALVYAERTNFGKAVVS